MVVRGGVIGKETVEIILFLSGGDFRNNIVLAIGRLFGFLLHPLAIYESACTTLIQKIYIIQNTTVKPFASNMRTFSK
jgi:hypothetical protein